MPDNKALTDSILRLTKFECVTVNHGTGVVLAIPVEWMKQASVDDITARLSAIDGLGGYQFKALPRQAGDEELHIVLAADDGTGRVRTCRYEASDAETRAAGLNAVLHHALPPPAPPVQLPPLKVLRIKPVDGKKFTVGVVVADERQAEAVKQLATLRLEQPFGIIRDALSKDALVVMLDGKGQPVRFTTEVPAERFLESVAMEGGVTIQRRSDSTVIGL